MSTEDCDGNGQREGIDPGPGPDAPGPTEGAPRRAYRWNEWLLPARVPPADPRDCSRDLDWRRAEIRHLMATGQHPDDPDAKHGDAEEAIRLGCRGAALRWYWRDVGAPTGDDDGGGS